MHSVTWAGLNACNASRASAHVLGTIERSSSGLLRRMARYQIGRVARRPLLTREVRTRTARNEGALSRKDARHQACRGRFIIGRRFRLSSSRPLSTATSLKRRDPTASYIEVPSRGCRWHPMCSSIVTFSPRQCLHFRWPELDVRSRTIVFPWRLGDSTGRLCRICRPLSAIRL